MNMLTYIVIIAVISFHSYQINKKLDLITMEAALDRCINYKDHDRLTEAHREACVAVLNEWSRTVGAGDDK